MNAIKKEIEAVKGHIGKQQERLAKEINNLKIGHRKAEFVHKHFQGEMSHRHSHEGSGLPYYERTVTDQPSR